MRLVQAVVCTWVWRTLYHQRAYKNKCMCKACCWTQSCGVWITKMLCSVSGIMRMLLHDSFYVHRGDRRHSDILLERKTWNDKDIVREAVVKQPVRAGKRTIYSTSYSNYSMLFDGSGAIHSYRRRDGGHITFHLKANWAVKTLGG